MTVIIRGNNIGNNKKDTAIYRNNNTRIYSLEKGTEVYTKYMEVYNDNGSLTKDSSIDNKYIINSDGEYYIPHIHTIMKGNKVIDIETTASRPTVYDVVVSSDYYIKQKFGINVYIGNYVSTSGFEYKGKYYIVLYKTSDLNYLITIDSTNEVIDVKNLSSKNLLGSDVTGVVFINDIIYVFNNSSSYILDIENLTITYHSNLISSSSSIMICSVFTFNNETYYAGYRHIDNTVCYIYKINDNIDTSTLISNSSTLNSYLTLNNCANNIVEHNGFAYSYKNVTVGNVKYTRIYKTLDFITFTLVSEITPSVRAGIASLHGVLYVFSNDITSSDAFNTYIISEDGIATMILSDYKKYTRLYLNAGTNLISTYNDSIYVFYNNDGNNVYPNASSFSIYNFGTTGFFKKGWKINGEEITEDGLHHYLDKNVVIEP